MESCLHFHSMIWIFYKNSSLVLSTLYAKLKLLSHISQWNIVIFFIQSYLPVWIHNNNSSLVLSTLDAKLNLLSHISQWNIVFSFIQSYLPAWIFNNNLSQIHVSNWIFCHISHNGILLALSFKAKNSCLVFKSKCQIRSLVTYPTMEFLCALLFYILFRMDKNT